MSCEPSIDKPMDTTRLETSHFQKSIHYTSIIIHSLKMVLRKVQINFYAKRFHIFAPNTISIPFCRSLSVQNRIPSYPTAHKKSRTQYTIRKY